MEKVSEEELKALHQALLLRYGVDFTQYESSSMRRRVARVIHRFDLEGMFGLWQRVLRDKGFIQTYIDEVTVGLTEMFRNPELWQALRDEILPQFRNRPKLRLWHAGCSTGEEVYTTAIVLREANLLYKSQQVATDINANFIETAAAGAFAKADFAKYARNYLRYAGLKAETELHGYFTEDGERLVASGGLKRHADFRRQDLLRDPIAPQGYELVFCRNVLIYFDDTLKLKVLRRLHEALSEGGYLVMGYYDTLPPNEAARLFEMAYPRQKIFRKRTLKP